METFCFQEVTLEIYITTNDVLNSFLREVLDYSGIATTSAKVLDGIDIQVGGGNIFVTSCHFLWCQVTKLLGRVLNQPVEYIHCWWSWGQWDEEKQKWTGAVGKVTLGYIDD